MSESFSAVIPDEAATSGQAHRRRASSGIQLFFTLHVTRALCLTRCEPGLTFFVLFDQPTRRKAILFQSKSKSEGVPLQAIPFLLVQLDKKDGALRLVCSYQEAGIALP